MHGYTKLFGSIVTSTIWREDKETKILWITMLALKNKRGVVEGSIPGLADMARLTIAETEKALGVLKAADPYSRTKDNEGRRIEDVESGWVVLNHQKWREKMNEDERREYLKIKKRESRAKARGVNKASTSVNQSQQCQHIHKHKQIRGERGGGVKSTLREKGEKKESAPSVPSSPRGAASTERSTKVNKTTNKPSREEAYAYGGEIGFGRVGVEAWYDHFESNGWKVSGRSPMKDWKAAMRNGKRNELLRSRPPAKLPAPKGPAYKPWGDVRAEMPDGFVWCEDNVPRPIEEAKKWKEEYAKRKRGG